MSDEIKEILEFKENADYKRLSIDEIKCLDDYITNLQKENKNLTKAIELNRVRELHEELKSAKESITWWTNRFNAVEKENERLKELINQYEEEHTTTFEEWKRDIRAFEELEKWLEEQENLYNKQKHPVYIFSSNTIRIIKNKIKELRGSE